MSSTATTSDPPLVGRSAELQRIEQVLERAAAGTSCGLFVLGQAGMGKSRLLAEGTEMAAACGLRTASASCLPLSVQLPLDPVLELLRELGEPFERPQAASPCELFTLAVEGITHAGRQGPLLICLDDVQWSDETTIEFVHYCLVRLRDLPLAWLLSSRPGRAADRVAYRFERASGLTRLELGVLTAVEVSRLTQGVLPEAVDLATDLATVAHARTAGHPLLTVELLQALAAELTATDDGGAARRLAATLVPARTSEAIGEWVAALSADARLAVECAATLRNGFGEDELEAAMGQAAGRALDELVEAGFLVRHGTGWTFRRTFVRDATYARLGAAERARRHVNLVAKLAQGAAVRHPARLEQAGRWREAARAYLELANHVLDRGEADDAVWLFGRAGDLAVRGADENLIREAGDGRVMSLVRAGTGVTDGDIRHTQRAAQDHKPKQQRAEPLSPREAQVVELVAAGHTNAEIAVCLSVSPKTVERHVSNVLAKLGFRSRVQVATAAVAGHLAPCAAPE